MGFFNETEEERKFKILIRTVKSSNKLEFNFIEYLVSYLENVRDKKINNDFYEYDFLEKVMLEIIDNEYMSVEAFLELKDLVKFLLPEGISTSDYESIKNMIVNNLVGEGNLVEKGLFDKNVYSLFGSRHDYMFIANLLLEFEELPCSYQDIFNYICEVAPWVPNQDLLRNEVVSGINGLKGVLDSTDEYFKKRIEEAKKRVGVYPIDEKTLALISSEAEKAQALIVKLDAMQKRVDKFKDTLDTLVKTGRKDVADLIRDGKKEIGEYSVSSIKDMQDAVSEAKKGIIEQLDEYLISLEMSLKQSSDKVFNQILLDTQDKLRQIRIAAEGLTSTTSTELLRIQQASQDSVDKLKKYVQNDPQLKSLLAGIEIDEKLRDAILNLNTQQVQTATSTVVAPSSTGILIPGHDRKIVPANPNVIIPKQVGNNKTLLAFDESIPFDLRLEKILLEKRRREEEEGEIFHEMTEEVIRCVMEGDWVYLWGPSGCGKSYVIKQVASLIGIDMISNGKITDKYSIMAYNDPHGNFRATQAFVALAYGKLLSLDEFDNGNPDTQVVLNELYSGLLDVLEDPSEARYITFAEDMTVPIHPNFRMISAGNTSGEGENAIFSSRGKIDESVQERMTPKRFNYDNRVEQRIFGEYDSWYQLFINFRKICDEYARKEGLDVPPGMATTRDASAIAKYIKHNSKSVDQVIREKFVQTKSNSYLNFIMKRTKEIYGFGNRLYDVVDYPTLSEVTSEELGKRLVLACDSAIKNGRR